MKKKRQLFLKELAKKFWTAILTEVLTGLHFDRLSKDEIEREINVKGIIRPNLPRIDHTENQAIFRKEVWGTAITLVSNLQWEKGEFCRSGSVWVHVSPSNSRKSKDRQLSIIFYKVEGLEKKVVACLKVLVALLKRRPLDSENLPMILKEKGKGGEFNFVSLTNPRERIPFLVLLDMPSTEGVSENDKEIMKEILSTRKKWQSERRRIEIAEDRKMGRRRDIKITWRKSNKK